MRKFFLALHKWLPIPVGIILVIVCLSGSILVFQDELQEWAHPERYFVKTTAQQPIPLEQLIPLVNSQLTDNRVKDVRINADAGRTYAMGLAEGFRVTAYVIQYTGKVTDVFSYRKSPFFVLMKLHRWLFDDTRTWGKYSVGISTLIFVFILITGLIIWFPKKLKKKK
ncbi:MAG: PepSY-associated TM helix domain-containing protein [Paludibacter sp.]|nr:PepSY-associated TM helix domain-containing protein [Paludibacter sp.]MDD4427944.1 PepSY-associated TM helix domain-containing protein [Paludibacter sp.]